MAVGLLDQILKKSHFHVVDKKFYGKKCVRLTSILMFHVGTYNEVAIIPIITANK